MLHCIAMDYLRMVLLLGLIVTGSVVPCEAKESGASGYMILSPGVIGMHAGKSSFSH